MKLVFLVIPIRTVVIRTDHFDVFQFAEKEAVSSGPNGFTAGPTATLFCGTFKRVRSISGECLHTRWLWSSTPQSFGYGNSVSSSDIWSRCRTAVSTSHVGVCIYLLLCRYGLGSMFLRRALHLSCVLKPSNLCYGCVVSLDFWIVMST